MDSLKFYFSIFRRRLPWFLVISTVISAVSFIVAYTLPPAYVSRMVLLVESPQIPKDLATPTVQTPAFEQLQIVQQRLMTRDNLLDIARRLDALPDMDEMNPDEIVDGMRARTNMWTTNQRLKEAPLLTVVFESPDPRVAAAVLNEYLNLIQLQDSERRKDQAGETLEFFEQQVEGLSAELDEQAARILAYKQANADALPESLDFRHGQLGNLQDRAIQLDKEVAQLRSQRERLVQLYEVTGNTQVAADVQLSPEELQLNKLQSDLDAALAVYSPENPRVKLLEARIAQLEDRVMDTQAAQKAAQPDPEDSAVDSELPPILTVQLSDIDTRVDALLEEKAAIQSDIKVLTATIDRTPEVSITLEEMTRKLQSLQAQYDQAEDRLARARTGELIETRSRGQRISVIEQPAIPSQPTKPNRVAIAGGGLFMGIGAGIFLIILIEMMNQTARRPDDIVNRFGVTPLTTVPYINTRGQLFRQRATRLLISLAILIGVPAAVYAVHIYYLPLDLIADKVMNKMGVRW